MAIKNTQKRLTRARRRLHIRKSLQGTAERPRLVVFRSNKEIYGQIIDDLNQATLVSAGSKAKDIAADIKKAKNKVEKAKLAGKLLAERAKDKKIDKVVFDRAGYLYHGRVKAFADGAREGGLEF